jgi:hypothetical protein
MTDFNAIAKNHLKGYSKALTSLLQEKKFDLIVAPANSGSAMIGLAEIITQVADLNLPRTLILPVFSNMYDGMEANNESLIPKIAGNNSLSSRYHNILFLDDEINLGTTFVTVIRLLKDAGKITDSSSCTILAEGNGHLWDYPIAPIKSDFLPYALRPNSEWHNLIFNYMPFYILEDFQDRVDMRLSPKDVAALLFSLPLKDLLGNKPFLNYELLARAEMRMRNFKNYQMQWLETSTETITDAIVELRTKEKARSGSSWGFKKLSFDF